MESDVTETILENLREAIAAGDRERLKKIHDDTHPADLAPLLVDLDHGERRRFFDILGYVRTSELLEYLTPDQLGEELEDLPLNIRGHALEQLPDDALADYFQGLDQDEREALYPLLSEEKRALAKRLLQYPEHTAGGRMTTAFAAIRKEMNVREAIESLRGQQDEAEILSRIFVVDGRNRLLGKVRLRDLTFANGDEKISELSDGDTTAARVDDDQEDAAQMLAKYDLVALPVVNHEGILLGIITHDDAMDILQQESTEDLKRLAAITAPPDEMHYLSTTVLEHYRQRVYWVVALAALGLISGYVIFAYEEILQSFFILTIYMPMLAATGGNTGSQSSTLIIRAMSLGEFSPSAFLQVIWKEFRIGILLGITLGCLISIKVFFFNTDSGNGDDIHLGLVTLVVALALTIQIVSSTFIGSVLPMLAKAARLDPAVVASPALTTCVDVSGLLIYFNMARLILNIEAG